MIKKVETSFEYCKGLRMYDSTPFNALKTHAVRMNSPEFHLKRLITDPHRLTDFSLNIPDFFYDFSRQRLDHAIRNTLMDLAVDSGATKMFAKMAAGKTVNPSENRAALHTAARGFLDSGLKPDDPKILDDIQTVAQNIRIFSENIHNRRITGTRGKAFTDAVVVGIGGSYLGCEFVYTALKATRHSKSDTQDRTRTAPPANTQHLSSGPPYLNLHFLSNVDIDDFCRIISRIDPDTCLWIIVSKSFTTTETMANLTQVQAFLKLHHLNPEDHLITITAKGSPGDDPSNPVLDSFHMFDFIGGRYSVTSAVGGVPLSLAFGYETFERFLSGCARMDRHALEAPVERNIPLTAALISIWNVQFLGYAAQAVIPYSSALSKLPPMFNRCTWKALAKTWTKKTSLSPARPAASSSVNPAPMPSTLSFSWPTKARLFPLSLSGCSNPGIPGSRSPPKEYTTTRNYGPISLPRLRLWLKAGTMSGRPGIFPETGRLRWW